MIKKYILHNFKNHADTELELTRINLLTGMNGAGKSSILQSMILMHDSFKFTHQLSSLYLKGDSFSLGRAIDAMNPNCKGEPDLLKIGIVEDEGHNYLFEYRYSQPDANSLKLISPYTYKEEDLNRLPFLTDNFQYLSAFRDGPQSVYESDTDVVDIHKQVSFKQGRGEMAVYFLNKYGGEPLAIDALCHRSDIPHTLREQATSWLSEITRGVQMKINQNDTQYELKFGISRSGETTRFYSAPNTGFGITYILSVIVAILSAKSGGLIIIENPEAHIHPAGQSALMRLIAKAARAGVQFLIETHSDHIVNGALVSRKLGVLDKDDTNIFFLRCGDDGNSESTLLPIGDDGRITDAPDEFFGQMNLDLEVLFGLNL